MLVKFSFISIVLALAAAQELYDRFDVRDAIEDVVDEYINARDVLWEDRDLIERALPSAGTCGVSTKGVFGCIPQTGGEPCGKCQPGTHGISCLCDPPQHEAEPIHPAGPSDHGSNPGGSSVGGGSDAGSQHQSSPEAQSPSDSSKTTKIEGSCLRYGRASIGEKMCQYLHPETNRWRLCMDRDVCPNPDNPTRCTCRVLKSDLAPSKGKKRQPNGGSGGNSNKKPKVVNPGPVHQ